MSKCRNCGSHVTPQFVRVAYPADVEQPPTCPHCPDMTNAAGQPGYRQKRS